MEKPGGLSKSNFSTTSPSKAKEQECIVAKRSSFTFFWCASSGEGEGIEMRL